MSRYVDVTEKHADIDNSSQKGYTSIWLIDKVLNNDSVNDSIKHP